LSPKLEDLPADRSALASAVDGFSRWRDMPGFWANSAAELDSKPWYGALLHADERLDAGGGARVAWPPPPDAFWSGGKAAR